MKYISIALLAIVALCGCAQRRQHIKSLVLMGRRSYPMMSIVTDGGSRRLTFITVSGEKESLYLDRSYVIPPGSDVPTGKVADGHVYWGDEAFTNRRHLDYTSVLADEIVSILTEYKPPDGSGPDSTIVAILDKIERERDKANQALEGTSQ